MHGVHGFDIGSIAAGMGMLIFAYLVLSNWQGANALLGTSVSGTGSLVKTLQGR